MKILILDNYDSFTYNLYQYVGEILRENNERFTLDVIRNDAINIKEIKDANYNRIIISPGPGTPTDRKYFGVCTDVYKDINLQIPILGICLGMQGMACNYGANIIKAKVPMHGKTSIITHDKKGVFQNVPQEISVMRYHSLIVEEKTLPDCFEISSFTKEENKEIMGLRHKTLPFIEGIQFHPESFATEAGQQMLSNFIYAKY